MSASWGAFVVKCMPIIRREALSLARAGLPLDVDDAVQEVVVQLLEDESESAAGNVRARIRSRLLNVAARSFRKKRAAWEIDIEHVPDSGSNGGLPSVASCEDEVIEKVDAMKLLDLWPDTKGGERAARRMAARWLPKFQEFAKRGAA